MRQMKKSHFTKNRVANQQIKISAIGKRRYRQLICTNLATPCGFFWNQFKTTQFK